MKLYTLAKGWKSRFFIVNYLMIGVSPWALQSFEKCGCPMVELHDQPICGLTSKEIVRVRFV